MKLATLTGFIRSLLLRWRFGTGYSLIEHVRAEHDQQDRPIANHAIETENVHRVHQEQHAETDQDDGTRRKTTAAGMQRHDARELVNVMPELSLLRRVIRLKGHVGPPHRDEHPEQWPETGGSIGTYDADQNAQDDDVDQSFHVLAVVDCADAWNHSENEC